MKNSLAIVSVLVLGCVLLLPGTAASSGLESFLDEVEISASKDMAPSERT